MNTKNRVLQTYVVNLICPKLKFFQADSKNLDKINIKKIFKKFFSQCLALPKDPQSFGILIRVLQAYVVNMSKIATFLGRF